MRRIKYPCQLLVNYQSQTTNYLKQNDFDYQGHLTIEKWLKVERNYINSKTSTTFSSKNALGTRFFIAHKVSPAELANFLLQKNVTFGDKSWTTPH